ncbi:O-antigen ligase [Sphingomonas limnosediminicola]|jgi:O-antigen ligase|uniref:O-antigen ligase n=1 Tax=Sphingomonas limnosediminicola TaxID=940133 RepID=A0ABP7KWY1_9SPHN
MGSRAREAVAPLYLLACLIAGGSAQGAWANMVLQLVGIAILAWAAVAHVDQPLIPAARQLLILTAITVAVILVQLVPLPPSIWMNMGGRAPIAAGFRTLGLAPPAMPVSLTPYGSVSSLLALIPPLAMFAAIVRLKAYRTRWLTAALLLGTVGGILLGVLQLSATDAAASPWYLYAQSSFGVATGFFANGNHMAILLVVSLPFLAALLGSARGGDRQLNSALVTIATALAIVIVVGIAINRSLAGIGLAFPVLAASALLVLPKRSSMRRLALVLAGLLVIGAVGVLATSSTNGPEWGSDVSGSVHSRREMLDTSVEMTRDFMPWGSGLGSYRQVYQLYEQRTYVTDTYVIHAHDDYLEIAVELGVAGILLMCLFLAWWGRVVFRAWRYRDAGAYGRAASIASAAILIHSSVDFPLRTAAIAVTFAMCLALLIERRASKADNREDLRPTRHVIVK